MPHARHFEKKRQYPTEKGSSRYGVLTGAVAGGKLDAGSSPHYEIWIKGNGANFRVAVNVQSVDKSEVFVHFDPNFTTTSPKLDLAALAGGQGGYRPLTTGPGGEGIDYLRDGLFDINSMEQVPDTGSNFSLGNLLDGQIKRAMADTAAVAIIFGQYFRDGGDNSKDHTFGFSPEQGLHDIHMMQGNSGSFASDNTINGDGALFIRFAGGETIALFTRFATQGTETDDQGNPTQVDG